MKAAVYKGNQQFQIEEIPIPKVGSEQVLVKVKYCAICGTDVHTVLYDITIPGSVMGHEFCGTIVEKGSSVSNWNIGDRVVGGGGSAPSGTPYGITADPRFSYRTGLAHWEGGAYAEYVLMEGWEPMSIPGEVPDEAAAMCEPCAIAVHAVRISDLKVGDTVAVLGAGPVGLLCLQVAKAAGCGQVFVSEPAPARREAALSLGADAVIDPIKDDAVETIVELSEGLGPHVVFECAAAKPTLEQGLSMARRHGQVILVAIAWEPTTVLPVEWIGREVTLKASASKTPDDWSRALELIRSGQVQMSPLLTGTSFIKLDGIQEAFRGLFEPTNELKIIVEP